MVSAERDQRNYKMKENFSKDVGQSGNFPSFPLSPWCRKNVFFTGFVHPILGWLPPSIETSPPTLVNFCIKHLTCTHVICSSLTPHKPVVLFLDLLLNTMYFKYLFICLEPLEDFAGLSFSSSLLLANSSADRC